jgi:hypothetical protein
MPAYDIECLECGSTYEQRLSFTEYDAVKAGKPLPCRKCGLEAKISFNPGQLGFILREGESGGWASKSIKENAHRMKRRERVGQKEKDHVFKSTLQPNFKGTETGTWREAQELARTEYGHETASTYEPLVTKEQRSAP